MVVKILKTIGLLQLMAWLLCFLYLLVTGPEKPVPIWLAIWGGIQAISAALWGTCYLLYHGIKQIWLER